MAGRRLAPLLIILALATATVGLPAARQAPQAILTILHFNDVYEIDAVEGGRAGGLSRVATLLATLKTTRAPLLTTLGGDFLSPSAIGTARIDGEALAGRQMVAVLNLLGLEWATFGNHEFDVSEAAFRQRLTEAKFRIVSSNVTDAATGRPFPGTVTSAIVPVRAGRRDLRIGLIGLTLNSNVKPWVKYASPIGAARTQIAAFANRVDAIVALTHLRLATDQALVEALPAIDLVLGGHEHENWLIRRGPHYTTIVKADANVRSVAVVSLTFGAPGARPIIQPRLQTIDERLAKDPAVEAEVRRWVSTAFDAFRRDGFDPETVVATTAESLDGRESSVRSQPTRLTDLVAAAMAHEVRQADVAIFNGGSIRIDDELPPGPIREYDVIRVLPFGGKVLKATFDGSLLASVLDAGLKNRNSGGYLQTWGVTREGTRWLVQNQPLAADRRYAVAINEFLLTGAEVNLKFLTRTNPLVHDVQEFRDVRQAVITELRARQKGTGLALAKQDRSP